MKLSRNQIAPPELREMVDQFRQEGLLKGGCFKKLTPEQSSTLRLLDENRQIQWRFRPDLTDGEPTSQYLTAVWKIRELLQDAVLFGLANHPRVREHLFSTGALPLPKTDWRFFRVYGGKIACWECGEEVPLKIILRPKSDQVLAHLVCGCRLGLPHPEQTQ